MPGACMGWFGRVFGAGPGLGLGLSAGRGGAAQLISAAADDADAADATDEDDDDEGPAACLFPVMWGRADGAWLEPTALWGPGGGEGRDTGMGTALVLSLSLSLSQPRRSPLSTLSLSVLSVLSFA